MENEMIEKLIEGRYKIKEKIAETNFSKLYKAVHVNPDNTEDKLLFLIKAHKKGSIAGSATVENEKITHDIANNSRKSIVLPVLSASCDEEFEYAVMRFEKNGKFLSDLIEDYEKRPDGMVPHIIQLEIILEILDSLSVLHKFNLVHTDLHPGNIFIENADADKGIIGTAKFIDFTNAVRTGEGNATRDYISITPGFSAPEQRSMDSKLQPQTDIYAVAAIAARMYTGKRIKDIQETYRDVLMEEQNEHHGNSILEYMFKKLIEYGLSDNPAYRYKSAGKMLSAVKNIKECTEAESRNDYYTVFSMAYDMIIPKACIRIESFSYNSDGFQKSVDELERALLQSMLNVGKCDYIFRLLWKMYEKNAEEVPEPIRNSLISSGIACGNHTGNSDRVLGLYDKLKSAETMSIRDYVNVKNRVAVAYSDTYQYESAYNMMAGNIGYLEGLKNFNMEYSKKCTCTSDESMLELGRAYSACAGYMALLGKDKDSIKEMYGKSLAEFGENKANCAITRCHMMNFAVMAGDEEYYWKAAEGYTDFDCSAKEDFPMKSLEKLLNGTRLNRFGMYILLKGIYTFYMHQITTEFVKKLQGLLNDRRLGESPAHPVQLIYKYIGLILYEYNDKTVNALVDKAFINAIQCIQEGRVNLNEKLNILMCITYQIMWIYIEITNEEEVNEEQKELLDIMIEHSEKSGWKDLRKELEERKSIEGIFDFEYC